MKKLWMVLVLVFCMLAASCGNQETALESGKLPELHNAVKEAYGENYIPSMELPTLPPQVRREPAIALDGGADGLYFYRRLAADSDKLLNVNGLLLMEHGYDQATEIADIMSEAGFRLLEVIKDYTGHQRGSLFCCHHS